MPTYEYVCKKCNRNFEFFQAITAKALTRCPKSICGDGGRVERQLGSGGGIIFKGSGFYATDYRSKSYNEAKKKDTAKPCEGGNGSCPNKGGCGES